VKVPDHGQLFQVLPQDFGHPLDCRLANLGAVLESQGFQILVRSAKSLHRIQRYIILKLRGVSTHFNPLQLLHVVTHELQQVVRDLVVLQNDELFDVSEILEHDFE